MKVLNISFGGPLSTNCQPMKSNACERQVISSQGLQYDTFQGSSSTDSSKVAKLEKQLAETQESLEFACKILAYKNFDKIEGSKSNK